MKTGKRLREMFARIAHVRVQMTLPLGARRVPEPDLLVVRGDEDDAPIAPPAADILLIVEVSDWTLAFDRPDKARLYARAGLGEYWLINLKNRQVEVHRIPDTAVGPGYADVRVFTEDESVLPNLAPPGSRPIPVADLLPPADETQTLAE
jgi:Uma2 family endonuclease